MLSKVNNDVDNNIDVNNEDVNNNFDDDINNNVRINVDNNKKFDNHFLNPDFFESKCFFHTNSF